MSADGEKTPAFPLRIGGAAEATHPTGATGKEGAATTLKSAGRGAGNGKTADTSFFAAQGHLKLFIA